MVFSGLWTHKGYPRHDVEEILIKTCVSEDLKNKQIIIVFCFLFRKTRFSCKYIRIYIRHNATKFNLKSHDQEYKSNLYLPIEIFNVVGKSVSSSFWYRKSYKHEWNEKENIYCIWFILRWLQQWHWPYITLNLKALCFFKRSHLYSLLHYWITTAKKSSKSYEIYRFNF